jgi:hypothetical protein
MSDMFMTERRKAMTSEIPTQKNGYFGFENYLKI